MTLSSLTERATDGIALASVATVLEPGWRDALQQYSDVAALLMPVAGVVWLLVQIISRITRGK